MKIAGIVLIVLGALALLGSLLNAATSGNDVRLTGLPFLILGFFLINRAKTKEAEGKERAKWMNDTLDE